MYEYKNKTDFVFDFGGEESVTKQALIIKSPGQFVVLSRKQEHLKVIKYLRVWGGSVISNVSFNFIEN